MGTKVLLVGILILSVATAAQGFVVGTVNGAGYFIGGPPSTSSNYASIGSPQNGAYVHQQATAFTPWGISAVGQIAGAVGAQVSGGPVQAQGVIGVMGQAVVRAGGSGRVEGAQNGGLNMTQTSPTGQSYQGMSATGMQWSGSYGSFGGIGESSESLCAAAAQIDVE